MRKEEIVNKNLDLHAEFMKYTFENPEILDEIPKGATLVILPENDSILYKENLKVIKKQQAKGLPVVIVKMKIPQPIIPHIEIISGDKEKVAVGI